MTTLRDIRGVMTPRYREQQTLFLVLADACRNNPMDAVIGAVFNLMITCVQRHAKGQNEAESLWDHYCGQGKEILRSRMQK